MKYKISRIRFLRDIDNPHTPDSRASQGGLVSILDGGPGQQPFTVECEGHMLYITGSRRTVMVPLANVASALCEVPAPKGSDGKEGKR